MNCDRPTTAQGYYRIRPKLKKRQLEHRAIIEKAIGKPIPKGSITHHVNGCKTDNRNSNLVLCQDRAYHNFIHMRIEALKACGNANWLKCCYCHGYDKPENLYIQKSKGFGSARHRDCHRKYMKEYHIRNGW